MREGMAGAGLEILLQFSGLVFRLNGDVSHEFPGTEADRGGAETVVVGLQTRGNILGHADVGLGWTGGAAEEIDEVHGGLY